MKRGKWIDCGDALPGKKYIVRGASYVDTKQIAFMVNGKKHYGNFVMHYMFTGFVDYSQMCEENNENEENGIYDLCEVDKWMIISKE